MSDSSVPDSSVLQERALQVLHEISQLDFQGVILDTNTDQKDFATLKNDLILSHVSDLDEDSRHRLIGEFSVLGPLSQLVADLKLSEIIIVDWQSIWIEKNGRLCRCKESFLSQATYQQIFQRICEEADVQVSVKFPMRCGSWRDFRLTVTVPPISALPTMSLRRKGAQCFKMADLKRVDFLSDRQLELLEQARTERKNLVFVGGTGSGKTTLLNAFLQTVPDNERVVTLEDTDELLKPTPSSSKLYTRAETDGSTDDVSLADLVRFSLRLRPDRIAVGEVRGGEAKDLLLALSSGHSGSCCTLHAEDPRQALIRLEMLIQIGAPQWSLQSIRNLIRLSIQWIVICRRDPDTGKRNISGIHSIEGLEPTGFLIDRLDEE